MLQASAHKSSAETYADTSIWDNIDQGIFKTLLDIVEGAENDKAGHHLEVGHLRFGRNDYIIIASLDRELELWYNNIPECLKWTPENIAGAKSSFFLFQ